MNKLLLVEGLALVEGEGTIETGIVPCRSAPRFRRANYVIRHGIVFEVEQLSRSALFQGGERDVCLEWADHSTFLARFFGVETGPVRGRLVVRLASRFDLANTWALPLARLDVRRVFTLRRAAACPGFHVAEWAPLRQG
jgi:hypothetical protein